MPGSHPSTQGIQPLLTRLDGLRRELSAIQTQQTQVISDPSHATGDPAQGWATTVIGNLTPTTGLSGFGIAIYQAGQWVRVAWKAETMHVVGNATTGLGTAFLNGWVNFGASYVPAGFYRAGDRVYLSGLIKSGTIGLSAFTLPSGFRPLPYGGVSGVEQLFPAVSNGAFGFVTVNVNGNVTPAGGSAAFFDLGSIDFRVS